jgi:hypothetical protein
VGVADRLEALVVEADQPRRLAGSLAHEVRAPQPTLRAHRVQLAANRALGGVGHEASLDLRA